ncbi:MAG: hypothetical protein H6622_04555 [Halobacteriovoraceae bacterium]|nr:hypothetical protein [Halobacteriovoraceae bacterium]
MYRYIVGITLLFGTIPLWAQTGSFSEYGKEFDKVVQEFKKAQRIEDKKSLRSKVWEAKKAQLKASRIIHKVELDIDQARREVERYAKNTKSENFSQSKSNLVQLMQKLKEEEGKAKKAEDFFKEQEKKLKDEVTSKGYKNVPKDVLQAFEGNAKKLLDHLTQGRYDAKFLINDIDFLQKSYRLDLVALEAIKKKSYESLNNTSLGKHVNFQIKRAIGNICEIKNMCYYKRNNYDSPATIGLLTRRLLNSNKEVKIKKLIDDITKVENRLGEQK